MYFSTCIGNSITRLICTTYSHLVMMSWRLPFLRGHHARNTATLRTNWKPCPKAHTLPSVAVLGSVSHMLTWADPARVQILTKPHRHHPHLHVLLPYCRAFPGVPQATPGPVRPSSTKVSALAPSHGWGTWYLAR